MNIFLALLALISSWFHPVAPPAPVEAPAAIVEAPVSTPETPAEIAPVAPSAEPTPEYANWMEALLPQVDPNGYGNWIFERNTGWGTSDGHNVWIDPNVPEDKRFAVVVHEYGHILQARYYGSVFAAPDFEHQADCMAQAMGANWLWYGCPDSLLESAQAVLKGK